MVLTPENYEDAYNLEVGQYAKVEEDYPRVINLIQNNVPAEIDFEITAVLAGTSLFTETGPDCIVVTKNNPAN